MKIHAVLLLASILAASAQTQPFFLRDKPIVPVAGRVMVSNGNSITISNWVKRAVWIAPNLYNGCWTTGYGPEITYLKNYPQWREVAKGDTMQTKGYLLLTGAANNIRIVYWWQPQAPPAAQTPRIWQ